MGNKKISGMTAATAVDGSELTTIVQGGSNKKATLALIAALANGAGDQITLTPGDPWDITESRKAKLTLSADQPLVIDNAVAGDFGQLILIKGAHAFYFPDNSKVPAGLELTGECVLGFYFDGTNYWWSADVDFEAAESAPTAEYLTWHTISPNMETYNSSKGIRRNGAGGNGWGQVAYSNETISSGETLYVQLASNDKARQIGLNAARSGQATAGGGWTFCLYVKNTGGIDSNNGNTQLSEDVSYAANGWIRFVYAGGNITCEYSADKVSWSTIKVTSGASGFYYVMLEMYEQATTNALTEVYKD